MTGFRSRLSQLAYGFLLVPGAVAVLFAVLALALVEIDRRMEELELGFGGDADAARAVLAAIAGSIITVAGLAFSITIVTLQLVSSQYSPRALRGFLRDRLNQLVAGVFVGTFAYCLLVLTTVRGGSDGGSGEFVPRISIAVAIALGVLAIPLLLVFIHHMSQSIQVSRIVADIGRTGLDAVERLYPERSGSAIDQRWERLVEEWTNSEQPALVHADRAGFVQRIDLDMLLRSVTDRGSSTRSQRHRLHLRVAPGDFVTPRTVLAARWPADDAPLVKQAVLRAVRLGERRDMEQDAGYAVRQLVDVALRAISPAMNDPTTAIDCIGYLQTILEELGGRAFPPRIRHFADADLTVVVDRRDFDDFVEEAFAELGRYDRSDPRLALRLLAALERTAEAVVAGGARERLGVVIETADAIGRAAIDQAPSEHDRGAIAEALERVRRTESSAGPREEEEHEPPGGRESSPGG